jgi:hypothetical protein
MRRICLVVGLLCCGCDHPLAVRGEVVTQDRAVGVPCLISAWKGKIRPLDGEGTAIATAQVKSGTPFDVDLIETEDAPRSDSSLVWLTLECEGYHTRVRAFEWSAVDVIWRPVVDLGRVWVPRKKPPDELDRSHREPGAEELAAIRGAVFDFQAGFLTADDPELVVCLEERLGDHSGDPPEPLVRRLSSRFRVRPVSACRVDPAGVTEAGSGSRAVVASVGTITRVGEAEARASGRFYWSSARAVDTIYRVVHEPSGWMVLGPILKESWLGPPPPLVDPGPSAHDVGTERSWPKGET